MKQIIINKKQVYVHYGIKAINDFAKIKGIKFNDVITNVGSSIDFESLPLLLMIGLNEGERKQGNKKRYSEDEAWDIIEDNPNLLIEIVNAFQEDLIPALEKLGDMGNHQPTTIQERANP